MLTLRTVLQCKKQTHKRTLIFVVQADLCSYLMGVYWKSAWRCSQDVLKINVSKIYITILIPWAVFFYLSPKREKVLECKDSACRVYIDYCFNTCRWFQYIKTVEKSGRDWCINVDFYFFNNTFQFSRPMVFSWYIKCQNSGVRKLPTCSFMWVVTVFCLIVVDFLW